MSDSDNQEVPQQPDEVVPPPRPESVWDVYNRKRGTPRELNEGDPNYNPDQDENEPVTEEELMRTAAIKCAEMEDEISLMLSKIQIPENKVTTSPAEYVFIEQHPGYRSIDSLAESIILPNGKPAGVHFNDGIAEDAKHLGIDVTRELDISIHADSDTQEAYDEFIKSNPNNTVSKTKYLFTSNGEYKKVSRIPNQIAVDPSRPTLRPPWDGAIVGIYESEMTPHDFEIAGQALSMLKNRLLEAQGQTPSESQQ